MATTKTLSLSERIALIEFHAMRIHQNFLSARSPTKDDVMESVQRLQELVKTIPKHEWAIPL